MRMGLHACVATGVQLLVKILCAMWVVTVVACVAVQRIRAQTVSSSLASKQHASSICLQCVVL